MVKRKYIRVLVPYSKTFYFIDNGTQRGATYELVKAFEKKINQELKTRHLKFHAIFIPTSRDMLIQGLVDGLGDIAVGNLTITDDRLNQVDFCDPMATGIDEILVTSSLAPKVTTLADLAGKEIHVRKSSSYYESLVTANKRLSAEGKPPIKIVLADENLEDEDLLEMLNANLMPMTIIDSHKGQF
jgi:membrane-bound lytic murein transglycosylase MltF